MTGRRLPGEGGADQVIIDCHVHVCPRVGGTDGRLPYQGRIHGKAQTPQGLVQLLPPSFERTDSPPELALAHLDWAGVDRAFLVQGPMYGFHNRYVAGAVARWPERFLGFAIVEPARGAQAAQELHDCREWGLRGLKVEWPGTRALMPGSTMSGAEEWKVWRQAKELGMPLFFHLLSGKEQVEEVRRIVEELDTRVIIAHLGGAPAEGWQEQVHLASDPRVYVSCSSIPHATREDFPAPKARDLLKEAVDLVGAEKIMWGSDYPGALMRLTYPQTLEWVRTYCNFLEPHQMSAVLGDTAETFARGLWP
jgi:predicted TIM-barrel fold metal-dependent hydrolase